MCMGCCVSVVVEDTIITIVIGSFEIWDILGAFGGQKILFLISSKTDCMCPLNPKKGGWRDIRDFVSTNSMWSLPSSSLLGNISTGSGISGRFFKLYNNVDYSWDDSIPWYLWCSRLRSPVSVNSYLSTLFEGLDRDGCARAREII